MQPAPTNAPVPPLPMRRRQGMTVETLTTIFGIILGVCIFGGLFAYHAIFLTPVPCTSSLGCTPPPPQIQQYANVTHALAWVAFGLMDVAVAFSVTAAFILGVVPSTIPEGVRRNFLLYAAVFLAVWIIFSSFILSSLLYIIRYY